MDMNSHPTGAYTTPPSPNRKALAKTKLLPLGAGVAAAAVGLVWLLAPGFQAPQAPAPDAPVPSAEPAPVAVAAPAAAVAAAPVAAPDAAPVAARAAAAAPMAAANAAPTVAAGREGGMMTEGVKPPAAARPKWVDAKVTQSWTWPRHLSIRNDEGTIDRRLVGWFPANPAAKRMLYALTVDRVETRLYEDEIAAFESRTAEELEARRKQEAEDAARKEQELAQVQAAQDQTAKAQAHKAAMAHADQLFDEAQAAARANAAAAAGQAAAGAPAAPAKAGPAKRSRNAIHSNPAVAQAAQLGRGPAYQAAGAAGPGAGAGGGAIAIGAFVPAAVVGNAAPAAKSFRDSPEYQKWLEEARKVERNELKNEKHAVSVRDVTVEGGRPMAELTYANGRQEVVPYDPLVFDLKGTGIKTSPKKVLFDLYAYGQSDKTQWMNDLEEGTGILVFDATGSGGSGKNGGEVFGDRTDLTGVGQPTGFANGFEALTGLARKAVGAGVLKQDVLDQGILDEKALAALEKAYGLKMKTGGFNRKPISLAAAGVKAIALSKEATQRAPDFDGQANDLVLQPGAVFLRADGTTGSYMNVWLKAKNGNLGLTTVDHFRFK